MESKNVNANEAELQKANVIEDDGEFMLESVPESKRRSTFSQVMVWIGFGYVVTGLLIGGIFAGHGGAAGLPPGQALWASIVGIILLMLITSFLGIPAQKTGLNLALLSRYSFGSKGIIIPMGIMALCTLGWFASVVGMIGDVWGAFIGNPSGIIFMDPANFGKVGFTPITLEVFLCCFVWGVIFTVTAYMGMGAIEKVATWLSPFILIIAVVYGFIFLGQNGGASAFMQKASLLGGLGFGNAVTIYLGSWMAGSIMGVDLYRFNKNVPAVFLCAASCFVLTNPILNLVGYIGAVQVNEFNYVKVMLGVSFFVAVIGVIVWSASLWTSNNAELYCNSLYTGPTLDAFGIHVTRKKLAVVCGVVGTILGSMAFYQLFVTDFINVLGSMVPPVCAPIFADYYICRKEKYNIALLHKHPKIRWAGIISFAIGAFLGFIFQFVWPLPYGLPSGLTALIIASIVYVAIYRVTPDKKYDDEMIAALAK